MILIKNIIIAASTAVLLTGTAHAGTFKGDTAIRDRWIATAKEISGENLKYLERIAASGDSEAQMILAYALTEASAGTKDPEKAARYALMAAEKQNPFAQALIMDLQTGYQLQNISPERAFILALRSAQQDNVFGVYNSGTAYMTGSGVDPDAEKAFEFFVRAFQLGHPEAQKRLCDLRHRGIGMQLLSLVQRIDIHQQTFGYTCGVEPAEPRADKSDGALPIAAEKPSIAAPPVAPAPVEAVAAVTAPPLPGQPVSNATGETGQNSPAAAAGPAPQAEKSAASAPKADTEQGGTEASDVTLRDDFEDHALARNQGQGGEFSEKRGAKPAEPAAGEGTAAVAPPSAPVTVKKVAAPPPAASPNEAKGEEPASPTSSVQVGETAPKKEVQPIAAPDVAPPGLVAAQEMTPTPAALPKRRLKPGEMLQDEFVIRDSGEAVPLRLFQGSVLLLSVYDDSCASCRADQPKVAELRRKFGKQGLQVISAPAGKQRQLVFDPVPAVFVIDKSGKVMGQYTSFGYPASSSLEDIVRRSLKELYAPVRREY